MGTSIQQVNDEVIPRKNGQYYSISVHNQVMEINPEIGGRITSLKIDGKDFLTDQTVNSFNWGSTFWFSPQSEWNWPPSPEIDNKPYNTRIEGKEIIMVSQKDPKTGFVVTKSFSGNEENDSFTLKYTITNASDRPQKVAPWEVTRVRTKGLAFFPVGKGEQTGGLLPSTVILDGISWFTYDESKLPPRGVNRQLYSDGSEGWLAQVNENFILVKKFPDVPFEQIAPNEGEVEWFASGLSSTSTGYVEIEHQGVYEELKPGDSTTWEVIWFLRELPKNMQSKAGNKALADYSRQLIK